MTAFEVNAVVDAYIEKEKQRIEMLMSQTWLTAVLSRPEYKVPSYAEFIGKTKQKEPQSAEQMFAMVQLMNAALGGD